jgi:hypothetical protein
MGLVEIQMEMQKLEHERRAVIKRAKEIQSRMRTVRHELYVALTAEAIERKQWATVLEYYRGFFEHMNLDVFTMLADAGYTMGQTPLQYDGITVDMELDYQHGTRYVLPMLAGFTCTAIQRADDEIIFMRSDGRRVKMWHEEDCCESVYIEDIVGDLDALIGKPLMIAEVVSNYHSRGERGDEQWTYYRLGTDIGNIVTIRWYGASSGYYSTEVTVEVME